MAPAPSIPVCSVCFEDLGKYGGPCSLPCGHNGCLQCMAHVQRQQPRCPICRSPFPSSLSLVVNTELRELMALAAALTTVDREEDWQAVTSSAKLGLKGEDREGGAPVSLVPSAPPLHVDLRSVLEGQADLMSLEPPKWAPDSSARECRGCGRPFAFLVRSRHHCRLCGEIFCEACSAGRLLLPPKFLQTEPQRVCGPCGELLTPLQPLLAGTVSKAVQVPVHDTTDWSVWRSLFNSPLTQRLDDDIFKSVNIVRHFSNVGALKPERGIPQAVLGSCAGLAILSVLKVGAGWCCGLGTGLVVARRSDGSWSAPSSVLSVSAGAGWQLGAELVDVVVVLRNAAAVRAFAGGGQLGLGGVASVAAGPLGREASAKLALGSTGSGALCYSYSCSRGAFVGVGLEGTLLRSRDAVNHMFYGRAVGARALLLSEGVPPPAAAAALYAALDELLHRVGSEAAAAAAAAAQFVARAGSAAAGGDGAEEAVWHGRRGRQAALMAVAGEGQGPALDSGSGGRGAIASPLSIRPHLPEQRRGRERERGVVYGDVHGAAPLWQPVGSAPVYSSWDEGQLPSLFD